MQRPYADATDNALETLSLSLIMFVSLVVSAGACARGRSLGFRLLAVPSIIARSAACSFIPARCDDLRDSCLTVCPSSRAEPENMSSAAAALVLIVICVPTAVFGVWVFNKIRNKVRSCTACLPRSCRPRRA